MPEFEEGGGNGLAPEYGVLTVYGVVPEYGPEDGERAVGNGGGNGKVSEYV